MVYEWDSSNPDVVQVDGVSYLIAELNMVGWYLKPNVRSGL